MCRFCKNDLLFSAENFDSYYMFYKCIKCNSQFYYNYYDDMAFATKIKIIKNDSSVIIHLRDKYSSFDLTPSIVKKSHTGTINESVIHINEVINISPTNYYNVVSKKFLNGATIDLYKYNLTKLNILH